MTLPVILVAVLLLASFVFAFLGARTWHWGYVLLVEAIFIATVVAFMFAAETLRINGVLRAQVKKDQKQVDEAMADVEGLRRGTKDTAVLNRLRNTEPPTAMAEDAKSIPSIEELDHELLIATRLRGRVWRNVAPAGIDPKTGAVKVNIAAPTPAGIKADSVVYVFEEGPPQQAAANGAPRGPQFLGEFNVTQAAGQQATLQPTQPLDPTVYEYKRLAASRGPWVIYETMPLDRYEIFAGMTDDQLKQLLPKQSVNEYLKNGKEATADDDPWRKVGLDENGKQLPPDQIDKAVKKIYQRRLRDYAAEFDELSRRRIAMIAEIDALKKDIEQLTAAEEVAKALQAARTAERAKLTTDLAGITKEREAIEKHLAQLNQLLAKAIQLRDEAMAQQSPVGCRIGRPPTPLAPGRRRQRLDGKIARATRARRHEVARSRVFPIEDSRWRRREIGFPRNSPPFAVWLAADTCLAYNGGVR